jgi:phage gp37-like protein
MLTSLETELIALIKGSALGNKVRDVSSLPDLNGKSLVQKFKTDAPAVYVAPGSFAIRDTGLMFPRFGIALVAKNAAGQLAVRQGDGIVIGLYDMIDALLGVFNGVSTASCAWRPSGVDMVDDELLFANGLYAAVVKVSGSEVTLPDPVDETTLASFANFHFDIDVPPFASAAVQAQWSQQNYTGGKPDSQDDEAIPT